MRHCVLAAHRREGERYGVAVVERAILDRTRQAVLVSGIDQYPQQWRLWEDEMAAKCMGVYRASGEVGTGETNGLEGGLAGGPS